MARALPFSATAGQAARGTSAQHGSFLGGEAVRLGTAPVRDSVAFVPYVKARAAAVESISQ